jgi:hypothetical protein
MLSGLNVSLNEKVINSSGRMSSPPSEPWWTLPQAALVEDRTRTWQLASFTPSDAISFSQDGQTVIGREQSGSAQISATRVIPDGWDHEHCTLCWATISLHRGDQPRAYTDGRDWLCATCYETFIVPRL